MTWVLFFLILLMRPRPRVVVRSLTTNIFRTGRTGQRQYCLESRDSDESVSGILVTCLEVFLLLFSSRKDKIYINRPPLSIKQATTTSDYTTDSHLSYTDQNHFHCLHIEVPAIVVEKLKNNTYL